MSARSPGWMSVVTSARHAPFLPTAGEREVLWLATAIPGSMVFLDDSDARRAALALSIPVSGTLGILLFAKQKGMIGLVRPLLDLLEAARFRMSPRLRGSVLDRAGESA